ncbi:MAG: 16S rRNA (guanine(966)-N(2))-methyltransferase RsmD [Campylobacterota bacterium]|nr:16S rRNA (guanine(966)-N(2))-methyltransferase RsmD [Campylobacterota bacterium]
MKNRSLTKKIVAGKYKGKTLQLPSKDTTRSSKIIVLESFFNTIQFDIIDATFVELFSGSGSIGLEALSRGAGRVIFMEQDSDALKILKSNIEQTDPSRCETIRGDSFVSITQVIQTLLHVKQEAYFYIDPPFSYREGMEDIYKSMLDLIASLPKEVVKMVAIEHMSSLKLEENIGIFKLQKCKKFGKTSLSYFSA